MGAREEGDVIDLLGFKVSYLSASVLNEKKRTVSILKKLSKEGGGLEMESLEAYQWALAAGLGYQVLLCLLGGALLLEEGLVLFVELSLLLLGSLIRMVFVACVVAFFFFFLYDSSLSRRFCVP